MGKTPTTGPANDETSEQDQDTASTDTSTDAGAGTADAADAEATEDTADQDATDAQETADGESGDGDGTDWEAKFREARKHSSTWEKRAKDNKTALDAALAENATLKQQLADKDAETTLADRRKEIAEAHGVPEAALRGETAEALTEHAKALQPLFPVGPDSKGAGDAGESVHQDQNRTAKDIVAAATAR